MMAIHPPLPCWVALVCDCRGWLLAAAGSLSYSIGVRIPVRCGVVAGCGRSQGTRRSRWPTRFGSSSVGGPTGRLDGVAGLYMGVGVDGTGSYGAGLARHLTEAAARAALNGEATSRPKAATDR